LKGKVLKMATVKMTKEIEIDDSIGSYAIIDILHNYLISTEVGISYYDLDAENQIIFLNALKEQLISEITETIKDLKKII
jgi:hypothetical protein